MLLCAAIESKLRLNLLRKSSLLSSIEFLKIVINYELSASMDTRSNYNSLQ